MKNWEEILLKPSDKLEIAIQVIHAGGLRIALVVDKNKKLLGTVTDGDIRRALIKHTSMDCPVEEVMNAKPLTALISDNPSLISTKTTSFDTSLYANISAQVAPTLPAPIIVTFMFF